MKYETPELKALTPAINAIQSISDLNKRNSGQDSVDQEGHPAYADWED